MVFNTGQIQKSDNVNWPPVDDPLASIDWLHDGYRLLENEQHRYLEEYMRDETISNGPGDLNFKPFAFTPEETRKMQESYRFSNELPDEALDGGSYMDDTSSMFGFESDYLITELDDGNMATYEKMCKYRRELDLQRMMMKKLFEKQVVRDREIERYLKQNEEVNRRACGYGARTRRNPLNRSSASPLLLMPIGEVPSNDNNPGKLSRTNVNGASNQAERGGQERRGSSHTGQLWQAPNPEDEALKRQWCSNRKTGSYPEMKWTVRNQAQFECRPPPPPQDDLYEPLPENLLVKVRNIHPTPSLHELHVQHPEIFRQKPTFTSVQYGSAPQRRKRFAVLCQFEFNGATLYAQETAPTKSDAKLNAARAMIRKLKHRANVSITLKEESMRAAADSSLEHPRCRLLHLHDTQPEIYPQPPTFRASRCRTQNIGKSWYTNMICYFQVGTDKLTTVGAAHNKKQAIVQAARNMLRLLALPQHSEKNNQLKVEYTPPDRTQTPWTCHFCKIFMTGRRPFMSHLMGRCHVQRLSELGLNAEDENKVLLEMAEKAFKEKEELKKKENAAKNNSQKLSQKSRLPKPARAAKKNTSGLTTTSSTRFPAATSSPARFTAVTPSPNRFLKPSSSSKTSSDDNPDEASDKSGLLISVPCSSSSSMF